MLLFEFFPAFVALVSIVAGIWLFLQNLEAERDARERGAPPDMDATRRTLITTERESGSSATSTPTAAS